MHTTQKSNYIRWFRAGQWLPMALGLSTNACLIDTDKPCRDNEVFDSTLFICSCQAGYGLTDQGCTKCGKNEEATNGPCACKAGYTKGTDGKCAEVEVPEPVGDSGVAEPTVEKLSAEGEGTMCTSDTECTGPDAKTCDPFVMACTITACTLDPNNCPDTYACCDVSAFVPGAPNVCIKDACPF